MSEKCPFCGAELHPVKPKYCCGTPKFIEPIIEDYRTIECYQRQLATAQLWRKKVEGLLKELAYPGKYYDTIMLQTPDHEWRWTCAICGADTSYDHRNDLAHKEDCLVTRARTFLTPPTPTPGGGGNDRT